MVKLADRITNLQPPPAEWTREKVRSYLTEARQIHNELEDSSPCLAARLELKMTTYGNYLK